MFDLVPRGCCPISNPEMIEHLYESCKERLSLGQNDIKSLTDRFSSVSEGDCQKSVVNGSIIERLRSAKKALPDDSPSVLRPRGLVTLIAA